MNNTLGKRIVQHRKQLGLTQDQLAEKLGVTAQAISKWENDQSCPDIAMLPRLAQIFSTTTDALLGYTPPQVHDAQIVEEDPEKPEKGVEIVLDTGRKTAFGFAAFVLTTGTLMLLAGLLEWDVSFWSILWPTALLIFGAFGLYPKFSFFRLGCLLFGGYFLTENLGILPMPLGDKLILPALVILLGLSLFGDACRRSSKKDTFSFKRKSSSKRSNTYTTDRDTFQFCASFGESEQHILLPQLSHGKVDISFGDYTVDLSAVKLVSEDCSLEVSCAFGELTVLIPKQFEVKANSSTFLGEFHICGQPDEQPQGTICLDSSLAFGEIRIEYI